MPELNRTELLRHTNHALRSPLHSILNITEMLLLGLEGGLDESAHAAVKSVREDAFRLYRNANAVLELVNLVMSPPVIQPVPVATSLQQVIEILQQRGNSHAIEVQMPDADLLVLADQVMLGEVFVRLIENLARFTPQPIRVTLRLRGVDNVEVQIGAEAVASTDEFLKDERSISILLCEQLIQKQGGTFQVGESHEPAAFHFILRLASSNIPPEN